MTTKPRAKKFRIRRSPAGRTRDPPGPRRRHNRRGRRAAQAHPGLSAGRRRRCRPAAAAPAAAEPHGAGAAPLSGMVSSAREASMETDIEAIRREGLTGRQLRMARRMAQKHGLDATSDFDAVRMLRERKGIDPFQRNNLLELVVPQNKAQPAGTPQAPGSVQLPQTVPAAKTNLPSTELSPAERRNREIQEIQRDIARRRRRKLIAAGAAGVLCDPADTGRRLLLLFGGDTDVFDEIRVPDPQGRQRGRRRRRAAVCPPSLPPARIRSRCKATCMSKDAMLRLDRDPGSRRISPRTGYRPDPAARERPMPPTRKPMQATTGNVKIGYDPTEGVMRMEVSPPIPRSRRVFAQADFLCRGEGRTACRSRSARIRCGGRGWGWKRPKAERRAAQERLVVLQQQGSDAGPRR